MQMVHQTNIIIKVLLNIFNYKVNRSDKMMNLCTDCAIFKFTSDG